MRVRAASRWLAVGFLGSVCASCGGDDPECTGSAFTGGLVTCGMAGTFDRQLYYRLNTIYIKLGE